jgi:undecaprenyl-diphosphatase
VASGPLSRRLPSTGRVGVQLGASVVVALAAFTLFVEVADNVIDRDEMFRMDSWVGSVMAPLRGPTGLAVARVVSAFGLSVTLCACALLLAFTLYRRSWRAVAVGWTLLFGGGKLVELILKHLFQRARPAGAPLPSYSYPSGHAMGSLIGYGLLTYLILRRVDHPGARAAITAGAGMLILAVGASRLVLGVHFFTDVVGGYAAGATWLVLSIAALEAERSWWHIEAAKRGGGG